MAELGLIGSDTELLGLLRKASSDDLGPLVHYITRDGDGDTRWTSELDGTKAYQRYYPDHRRYYREIAAEIQLFGGNTIANQFRGHGVPYREVLEDVSKRFDLDTDLGTEELELELLATVAEKAYEKMKPAVREAFLKQIGAVDRLITPSMITAGALQSIVRASGFAAYQVAVIVANATAKSMLGRGLSFAANAALTRSIGLFMGPVGWVIQGLWTAYDLAGPAFRITVPCVIHVAYLRQALKAGRSTRGTQSSKATSKASAAKKTVVKKPSSTTAVAKKVVNKSSVTTTRVKKAVNKSTNPTSAPKKAGTKKK